MVTMYDEPILNNYNLTMTIQFNDYISPQTQLKAKKLIKDLKKFRKTLK